LDFFSRLERHAVLKPFDLDQITSPSPSAQSIKSSPHEDGMMTSRIQRPSLCDGHKRFKVFFDERRKQGCAVEGVRDQMWRRCRWQGVKAPL
jgi:hypothetical protein